MMPVKAKEAGRTLFARGAAGAGCPSPSDDMTMRTSPFPSLSSSLMMMASCAASEAVVCARSAMSRSTPEREGKTDLYEDGR